MKKREKAPLAVVLLYLSLVICVLGRPQASSLTDMSHSTKVLEVPSAARFTAPSAFQLLRISNLQFSTRLWPSTQGLRRSLKGKGGGGGGGGGGRVRPGGGGVYTGSGGSAEMSKTATIILWTSVVAAVIIVCALLLWCHHKRKKNPTWTCFDLVRKTKKPATEKSNVDKNAGPPPDSETHKITVDAPRLDTTAKSRKQASRDMP